MFRPRGGMQICVKTTTTLEREASLQNPDFARNMQIEHPQLLRFSRKGKERHRSEPQPTDLDEKIIAPRRIQRNAACVALLISYYFSYIFYIPFYQRNSTSRQG